MWHYGTACMWICEWSIYLTFHVPVDFRTTLNGLYFSWQLWCQILLFHRYRYWYRYPYFPKSPDAWQIDIDNTCMYNTPFSKGDILQKNENWESTFCEEAKHSRRGVNWHDGNLADTSWHNWHLCSLSKKIPNWAHLVTTSTHFWPSMALWWPKNVLQPPFPGSLIHG